MPRRGKWETVFEILSAIQELKRDRGEAKKNWIYQKANLAPIYGSQYLQFLLDRGLLKVNSKCYELTKEGEELMRNLKRISRELKNLRDYF